MNYWNSTAAALTFSAILSACVGVSEPTQKNVPPHNSNAQLGPRPFYLVDQLAPGPLKARLQSCNGPYRPSDFSIGHRGAPLQFPENTKESYLAAARMGAGILECDVTFTKDAQLVCRHDECDLHDTTNILITELAQRCEVPFTPATFDELTGELDTPATAFCCSSDLTLNEFKTLQGKMAGNNPLATSAQDFLMVDTPFRTELYSTGGTLLSHSESIQLFELLGVKHAPELKEARAASVSEVFGSQTRYAQQFVDNYKNAGVKSERVYLQSFALDDVLYWLSNEPEFGQQAIFLVSRPPLDIDEYTFLNDLADVGVKTVAPPIPMLIRLDENNAMAPSDFALAARQAGLNLITWTLERSGRIREDVLQTGNTHYYQTVLPSLSNDGDILELLDVLAMDVGVIGVFSDWPATTTFYANCSGL